MAKQMIKQAKPELHAKKKVFIIDDHPVFRYGLAQLVNREPDLTVCGEVETTNHALDAVPRMKPHLVLLDLSMPGKSGLELIKDLRVMCPESAVLVISMYDETLYADRVLRAGAQGYIMKQEVPEKMLEAMREVLDGRISVSQRISAKALDFFAQRRSVNNTSPIERLSDREFEILQLIGQGRENHGIAEQLHLSFKTVHAHRSNIKVKLNLKSDLELIRYSVRWMDSCDVGATSNGSGPAERSAE